MDFSHIVVNEVEIETSNVSSISENQKNKTKSIASRERPFFELSDYSNGALLDELNYCWSQSFTDIDIHVRLPENVTSKQLKVNISATAISVVRHQKEDKHTILDGTLSEQCKAAEAMWTITAGNKLNISIDKQKEIWWKKLFVNELEIDMSKIDCSRPIEELNEGTQAEIEKIRWDEQQKLKGEMTSAQVTQHEMLRKAWNAEGSPFKGTPFDPNVIQFENTN